MTEHDIPESVGDDDLLIRERLNSLLAEHSQSDIARKTGALVASVNRYVHGARIPAAFCASLVRSLGVNPSWLLVGEGSPNLGDVPANTAKLGENLLALVEAMSAVSRMRLGSLTGKHHLKVLRELNDALAAHERLREKLNEQSRPIFAQILKDLQNALDKRDLARAGEFRKAAEQISRLCDDENLARDFYRVQAYHEFQLKNSPRFLQLQRQLFLRSLPNGSLFDERACDEARRLVVALVQMNRLREALRICRAVKNLAGKNGRGWDSYARLENTHGVILAELGSLRRGMTLVQSSLPRLTGMYRKISEATLAKFMLWGGLLTIEDALHMGEHTDAKVEHFLQHACWLQDAKSIERTLVYAKAPDVEPVWRDSFFPQYAKAMLAQLQVAQPQAGLEFRKRLEANVNTAPRDEAEHLRLAACCAQIHRIGGNVAEATAETWRAEGHRKALSAEIHAEPMALATHYRSVMLLFAKPADARERSLVKRARRFFLRRVRTGFAIFESLV